MGLFDKFKNHTKNEININRLIRRLGFTKFGTTIELHHIYDAYPAVKEFIFKNVQTNIDKQIESKLIKKLDEEISNHEIYKKIHQFLLDNQSNTNEFYITLNYKSLANTKELFKIEIEQLSNNELVLNLQLFMSLNYLNENFTEIQKLFDNELEKLDFTNYKDVFEDDLICKLKQYPKNIYIANMDKLLKKYKGIKEPLDQFIEDNALEIKNFDDLMNDIKKSVISTGALQRYEVENNFTVLKNLDMDKIGDKLKNKIETYINSITNNKATVENSHKK